MRRRASAYWRGVLALGLFVTWAPKGNTTDPSPVGTVVVPLTPFFDLASGGSRMSGCPVSERTAVSTDPVRVVEGNCMTDVAGSCFGLRGAVAGSADR